MTTKEKFSDEFKRRENAVLAQMIKSVSITFDRNQLKDLVKLRISIEKKIVESGEPESSIEDELKCLVLLNTILMDIEDEELKSEWAGSEIMNERLSRLKQEPKEENAQLSIIVPPFMVEGDAKIYDKYKCAVSTTDGISEAEIVNIAMKAFISEVESNRLRLIDDRLKNTFRYKLTEDL